MLSNLSNLIYLTENGHHYPAEYEEVEDDGAQNVGARPVLEWPREVRIIFARLTCNNKASLRS